MLTWLLEYLNVVKCGSWVSPVVQLVKNPSAMQEMWIWSLGQENPLEQRMASHSSLLPWRIPWAEEPDRLQSMGLQCLTHTHTHTHIPTDMVHIFLWIELSRGFLLLNDPFSPFQM